MYEDDTIRLFGIANLLKNKKNNSNNWERDDIPDVKPQALTGKYDHNFDAPGSDFVRAHNYNFHNIDQPENTKSDVKYDDKYTKFFNYTPSKYIQLEEEEYKPIGKYNEKADEYYIDKLQGKTLDDMVISKMKENAGADDLDPRAARERFAENLAAGRLQSALEEDDRLGGARLDMFGNMEEEGAEEVVDMAPKSKREQRKINKSKQQQPKVQIEPVHQSPQKSSKSKKSVKYADEEQEGGGGGAYVSPKKKASQQDIEERQKQLESEEKEEKYRAIQKKRAERRQIKDEEEANKKQNLEKLKNSKDKQTLGNVFGALKHNAEKNKADRAVTKIASAVRGKQARNELQKKQDAATTIASAVRGRQAKNELQTKRNAVTKIASAVRGRQARNELQKKQDAATTIARVVRGKQERNRLKDKNTDWDEEVAFTDAATTDAASYMVSGEPEEFKISGGRGQPTTARNAAYQRRLQLKLPVVLDYKKAYENVDNDEIVSKDVIIKYNKDVTPKNAIRVTGPPLTVKKFKELIDEEEKRRKPNPPLTAEALSDFNTPQKGKKSVSSGSLSPKLAIKGMYSHNNPKTSSK